VAIVLGDKYTETPGPSSDLPMFIVRFDFDAVETDPLFVFTILAATFLAFSKKVMGVFRDDGFIIVAI
jgi:hypothetical protein